MAVAKKAAAQSGQPREHRTLFRGILAGGEDSFL